MQAPDSSLETREVYKPFRGPFDATFAAKINNGEIYCFAEGKYHLVTEFNRLGGTVTVLLDKSWIPVQGGFYVKEAADSAPATFGGAFRARLAAWLNS